jgi:hypothetical protein
MTSPFHLIASQVHIAVWGERDASGNAGCSVRTKEGLTFILPVILTDNPAVETPADHRVENPIKYAGFRAEDWQKFVPDRDPDEGDVMTTLDRKKWDIAACSPGTDGMYLAPLYVYRP